MKSLRTPDEQFDDLPGFGFDPHYVEVDDGDGGRLRVHYLDEAPTGNAAAGRDRTMLLMHGEPSWCYLYRHMIPVLTAAGYRCVAPDLVGFGRSDKPSVRTDYTYQRHVDWMRAALFDALDLRDLVLMCQDWGGLIGLRLLAEHSDRFAAAVAANTFLPTGDRAPGEAFDRWRNFSQSVKEFPSGFIVNSGCTTELDEHVVAAYDAPFPDESYKEGARQFPTLVPARPDDPASDANRAAWERLHKLETPFLCAFGDSDPITAGSDKYLKTEIPGAAGQPHTTIAGGGHFIQEDRGVELAEVIVSWLAQLA
jgi:haloalkane dehalogenase